MHSYTNLINCAVRCGKPAEAAALYADMRAKAGVEPNVVTVTAMLKGLSEAGDARGAKALLDEEIRRSKVTHKNNMSEGQKRVEVKRDRE